MSNTDFEYNFYIGYFKVGFTEYFTWLRRILYLTSSKLNTIVYQGITFARER